MSRAAWLLPAVAALAAAGVAAAWRTRWRRPAAWLAAALAGYAASLRLVEAGPGVRYQHYLPPARWLAEAPEAALALLAYAGLVAWGLYRHRRPVRALAAGWRAPALAVVALALVLTSATLSADPGVYAVELLVASAVQAAHLGAVLLAAATAPDAGAEQAGRVFDRLAGPEAGGGGPDRLVLAAAAAAVVIPALLAVFVYQLHPHVPDEVPYLLHARYFAAGRLFLPVPEPYPAFDLDLMFAHQGRWYSPVPPGWPAVLAAGAAAGVPWLVNPLLNGLNTLLTWRLGLALFDRGTARLAALLFALSPWNLFLGMSLLTHGASLAAALAAALAVAAFRRGGSPWVLAAGGAAIGAVSLIRPLEGLIVAGLLGLWALGARPLPRALAGVTLLGAATALVGALALPYNRALTGDAGTFPIMAYADSLYGPGSNAMGFGPNRGLGWRGLDPLPGHGPLDVLINANLNLFALNVELFGWATGSVLLLALFLVRGPLARADRLLVASIAAVIAAHSAYWFSGGPDFGPRYWYLIVVPCVLLAARALRALPAPAGPAARGRTALVALALATGATLVFVPWRAADKYFHYRGMEPGMRRLADSVPFGADDLVLVRGRRHPDYASAAPLNPLDLDAPAPIYAWDRDSTTRAAVLARYPGRRVWLVDGPTVTGAGFQVAAGPIAPGAGPP